VLVSGILDRLEVAFRLMASTNWAGNNQVRDERMRRIRRRKMIELKDGRLRGKGKEREDGKWREKRGKMTGEGSGGRGEEKGRQESGNMKLENGEWRGVKE
jgi:hypothetical protein